MQNLKIVSSDSYHDYLIESLKDPQEAAAYLEVALEEGGDQPELLKKVIHNILEAKVKINKNEHFDELYQGKIDQFLSQSNCAEIYAFVELLKFLGLQILIQVKEDIAEV